MTSTVVSETVVTRGVTLLARLVLVLNPLLWS